MNKYEPTEADLALIAEAQEAFSQDFRYLETMLREKHKFAGRRAAVEKTKETNRRKKESKWAFIHGENAALGHAD